MKKIILPALIFLFSFSSYGYFSVMDTGDLKEEGEYRILGEGQILLDSPKGFNFNGRFSTGFDVDSEIQFEAGIGSIDFYLGAFWKWVPFPDTEEQPAIGARFGVTFAEIDVNGTTLSTYGFNVTPLVSKKFALDFGKLSPYAGLPIGLKRNTNDTNMTLQAAVGVEWQPDEWEFEALKDFNFLVEYGAEIDDAFSYFTVGANYDF